MRRSGKWYNSALLKDCGLIPYLLYKNHGFRSVMVTNGKFDLKEYPSLEKYLSGLEMDFTSEDTLQARFEYINVHADEIDLMILYGAYNEYIPLVEFYKKVRPDGKVYLATDMNMKWANNLSGKNVAFKKLLQTCDVVAASCRATQKHLSVKWGVPVDLIRNGWYNFAQISFDNVFEHKENIILTVGRIGSEQKRNEDLLMAFAKVANDLPDWRLRLAGNVPNTFKPYIEKYFEVHPTLRERVTFTGFIADKAILMEEYKRAKIFCMTSTFEGAPNVAAEALFSGDYVITSAVDAASDMTDDGNCGKVFPVGDIDALARIFREVCPNTDLLLKGGQNAVEHARRNFDAEHIVAHLHYLLYGGETK